MSWFKWILTAMVLIIVALAAVISMDDSGPVGRSDDAQYRSFK